MAASKVVAVFGATGQQGGSVVRSLLADKSWTVRALTRKASSPKAQELLKHGAKVHEVDLDDPVSIKNALKGADSAFVVTSYWDHLDETRDERQGRNAVHAAVVTGVKHLVYSGLENVRAMMGYAVPHFDAKGRVEEELAKSPLHYTIVRLPFYFENFLQLQKIKPDTFSLVVPMGNVPMDGMSVAELGQVVKPVLDRPDKFKGQTLGLSADRLTVEEYATVLSKHLAPLKFVDSKITVEAYAKLGFPGAEELAAMFRFYQDGVQRDVKATRLIAPELSTFNQFVDAHKKAFLDAAKSTKSH